MAIRLKKGDKIVTFRGRNRWNWDVLREKFISMRASGMISLADFAKEEGVPFKTLVKEATKGQWIALARKRAEERHKAIEDHARDVMSQLRKKIGFDEVEVRSRHANALRALLSLGMKKLIKLAQDPNGYDQLSIDQMIEILRYIPAQERAALGLPETVMEVEVNNRAVAKMLNEFRARVQDRQRVALLAASLMKTIDGEVLAQSSQPVFDGDN
jgi:hypothetical protein